MYILGVDTTGQSASVGILHDDKIIADFTLNAGNTHSTTLLPMIEAALKLCGIGIDDIDLFGASVGPGSFTGLRIGVATVKGLAVKNNVPCVPVSGLSALAENLSGFGEAVVCPLIDARRERAYFAVFRIENSEIIRLTGDAVAETEKIEAELEKYKGEKILRCGDGAELVKIGDIAADNTHVIRGAAVAKIALRAYKNGEYVSEAELLPVYLQKTQAEREREAALKTEK